MKKYLGSWSNLLIPHYLVSVRTIGGCFFYKEEKRKKRPAKVEVNFVQTLSAATEN